MNLRFAINNLRASLPDGSRTDLIAACKLQIANRKFSAAVEA
jgi:hypothetical protein